MKKIFLSYSTADEHLVNEVYEILKLKLTEYELFKFNNNDYKTPQSWSEIDNNLEKADIFLIFISKISIQSKAVRAEMYAAFHKSIDSPNFIIKPIVIDDYTNWENEFKPSSFPILNSIHRIEEFNRDSKTLSKYIIDNIDKNQWPNYVPNIQLKGILIQTTLREVDQEKKCFIFALKSNIDLDKVEFLYNTEKGYLNGNVYYLSTSCKIKPFKASNGVLFNHLSLFDNSEISKIDIFYYNFVQNVHFKGINDEIKDIWLKVGYNKYSPILLKKFQEMTKEELDNFDIISILDSM